VPSPLYDVVRLHPYLHTLSVSKFSWLDWTFTYRKEAKKLLDLPPGPWKDMLITQPPVYEIVASFTFLGGAEDGRKRLKTRAFGSYTLRTTSETGITIGELVTAMEEHVARFLDQWDLAVFRKTDLFLTQRGLCWRRL
jgi:hypothetical protein